MQVVVTDPEFYAGDPYPAYRWLREHAPLYRDETSGVWVVSRHADVVAISKDARLWSAVPSVLPDKDVPVSIVCMDEPRHLRLRNLINKGFTPRRVKQLEVKARGIVHECLDRIGERREFDLAREVAVVLPLYIIAEMIGIPREGFARFHRWSDALIGATGAAAHPELAARSIEAYGAYGAYLKDIFEQRRREPRDDLVSILVAAQDDGALAADEEAMQNDELVMFMTLLLVAGNETTRNAISGGMEAFLRQPEQRELLLQRPELLDSAVEEILRYVSPIVCFRRNATRDTELHGQAVRRGERVVMLYQAANRDPEVFSDPERFDVTRQPNPHVAFGIGNHFCLGANLARMEIRVAVEELMARYPRLDFAPGAEPVRVASTLVRGIDRMAVVAG